MARTFTLKLFNQLRSSTSLSAATQTATGKAIVGIYGSHTLVTSTQTGAGAVTDTFVYPTFSGTTLRPATHEVLGTDAGYWFEVDIASNGAATPDLSGATTGTLGSGGTLPTSWEVPFIDGSGLSTDITVQPNGNIRIRKYGTGGGGAMMIGMNSVTGFSVTASEVLTGSVSVQLVSGSTSGLVDFGLYIVDYTSGGYTSYGGNKIQQLSSDIPWVAQVTHTAAGDSAQLCIGAITATASAAIDITFEIQKYTPQLEKHAYRTSVVGGSSRTLDQVTHTLPTGDWTVDIVADMPRVIAASVAGTLWQAGQNADDHISVFAINSGALILETWISGASANQTILGFFPPGARIHLVLTRTDTALYASINNKPDITVSVTPPEPNIALLGIGNYGMWNSTAFKPIVASYDIGATARKTRSNDTDYVFDDFSRSNGSIGSPWQGPTWINTGAETMSISNTYLVCSNTASEPHASYAISSLSVPPKYLGAIVRWSAGADGSAAAMFAMTTDLSDNPTDYSAIHTTFQRSQENWQSFEVVGGVQTFDPNPVGPDYYVAYTTETADLSTLYGHALFVKDDAIVWYTPYGEAVRKVDSRFSERIGRFTVFEHFFYNTQSAPQFKSVMASLHPVPDLP